MKRYLPLVLAILALVMLLAAGLGARAGLWHFRTGFTMLKWSAYAGMLAALVAILFMAVPRLRGGSVIPAAIALVIALGVVYMPWSWQKKARGVPGIHDITTDMQRPPEFVAVLPLRASAPNPPEYGGDSIAAKQKEAYPDIQPIMLSVAPDAAFRKAQEAAQDMGWEMVSSDAGAGRIEATATTPWFGFKDDVVIRIEPAGTGSRVDVRSVSRVGRGDVGTNAARIRAYTAKLRERV